MVGKERLKISRKTDHMITTKDHKNTTEQIRYYIN